MNEEAEIFPNDLSVVDGLVPDVSAISSAKGAKWATVTLASADTN